MNMRKVRAFFVSVSVAGCIAASAFDASAAEVISTFIHGGQCYGASSAGAVEPMGFQNTLGGLVVDNWGIHNTLTNDTNIVCPLIVGTAGQGGITSVQVTYWQESNRGTNLSCTLQLTNSDGRVEETLTQSSGGNLEPGAFTFSPTGDWEQGILSCVLPGYGTVNSFNYLSSILVESL